MPGDLLNNGTHLLHFGLSLGQTEAFRLEDLLVFEVHDCGDLRGMFHGESPGALRPSLEWTTEEIDSVSGAAPAADPAQG